MQEANVARYSVRRKEKAREELSSSRGLNATEKKRQWGTLDLNFSHKPRRRILIQGGVKESSNVLNPARKNNGQRWQRGVQETRDKTPRWELQGGDFCRERGKKEGKGIRKNFH